jgi:ATP-dependent DNA ligase
VYEEKYDGWRIVGFKDGTRVRLVSRTGRDHAGRFPDLAANIASLPASTLILDGSVCVFGSARWFTGSAPQPVKPFSPSGFWSTVQPPSRTRYQQE